MRSSRRGPGMKLSRDTAAELMYQLGFKKAHSWSDQELYTKVNRLAGMDAVDVFTEHPGGKGSTLDVLFVRVWVALVCGESVQLF